MTFNRINISTTDAVVRLVDQNDVTAQIDVSRRPDLGPISVSPEFLLFGSPSADTFVVRWNKSYELVLHISGVILFKYGEISNEDESRLVGIGFSVQSSSGPTAFRIDKSPGNYYLWDYCKDTEPYFHTFISYFHVLTCITSFWYLSFHYMHKIFNRH